MDDKRDPLMGDGRWEEGTGVVGGRACLVCGVAVATPVFRSCLQLLQNVGPSCG